MSELIPTPASIILDLERRIRALERVLFGLAIPYVTALPASPADGDEVYFRVADGVVWHLRYKDALSGTSKWEFLGGPPLFNDHAPADSRTSTNFGDLNGGAGPTILLPLAGDYVVGIGAGSRGTTLGAEIAMSYSIGGSAAVEADMVRYLSQDPDSYFSVHREMIKTGFSAETALTTKYKATPGTGVWRDRYIRATPRRVG